MADKKAKMVKLSPVSDDDWQVQADLRTLIEYKKMCKDKKRYDAVLALAKQKKDELSEVVTDLIEEKMEGEE